MCSFSNSPVIQSATSRAWRACVLACFACLCACVFTCLVCLHAYVLACLACLSAAVLGVLACGCACYDEMFYFLTCLCTWCAFLSYLLYISILKFKNFYSEKLVCFVKLNIFLIYVLIPTYKTIWNQFKESRKVNRYII